MSSGSMIDSMTGQRGGAERRLLAWSIGRELLRFAAMLALTLLGLIFVTFLIGRIVPIDPVLAVVGDRANAETYARVREELGIDLPVHQQFWIYLSKVAQGDFGTSVITS